jgi:aconitate hydratase
VITDPRSLGRTPRASRPHPITLPIDDRHFIFPNANLSKRPSETLRGPNIVDPPRAQRVPEHLDATVLIVLPDDVSTGDMAPDGALAMAIWANIPECAKAAFQRFDRSFYDRARLAGGGIIVAGHNYGQGSSRESAALVPLELGIRVIIARSFARIHRTNLIAQGIVPLELLDERETVQGERWIFNDLAGAITRGDITLEVKTGAGIRELGAAFTSHERRLLSGGGALQVFRHSLTANQDSVRAK